MLVPLFLCYNKYMKWLFLKRLGHYWHRLHKVPTSH
nr:MAG TPA_asm: hypothetical protein [Caudoviricetes sp.]